MNIVHREDQQLREHALLSADAAKSDESEGRARSGEPDFLRTEFQRDRDKILHCKSFRRLSHKNPCSCRRRRSFPHAAYPYP